MVARGAFTGFLPGERFLLKKLEPMLDRDICRAVSWSGGMALCTEAKANQKGKQMPGAAIVCAVRHLATGSTETYTSRT